MTRNRFGSRLIETMPSRAIDLRPRLARAIDALDAVGEADCASVFELIRRRTITRQPLQAQCEPHQDLAGWKRAVAVATAVILAPVAALALLFLAPALLLALLGCPMFIRHGTRTGCTRFPPARLAS